MNFTPTVENCSCLACHVVFEHTRKHCGTSYHLQEGRICLQFPVMDLSRKYLNPLDLCKSFRLRQNLYISDFCRDTAAIFKMFSATKPRFLRFLPRHCRDFYDFCRDNAAIFDTSACRGTAIFGLKNRDKFLPLQPLYNRKFDGKDDRWIDR